MDMREMVDKVKKGEPLYGKTEMTEYQQGMASRNSRYSSLFLFAIPWFNLVNHNQVCYATRTILDGLTNELDLAWCRHSEVLPAG